MGFWNRGVAVKFGGGRLKGEMMAWDMYHNIALIANANKFFFVLLF